jgi:hypothetical protein
VPMPRAPRSSEPDRFTSCATVLNASWTTRSASFALSTKN